MPNGEQVEADEVMSEAQDSSTSTAALTPERWLDEHFEPTFFKARLLILVPVVISFTGSAIMFAVGANHILNAMSALVFNGEFGSKAITLPIIKALDAFLVGIILVIFSFGIYDFFISRLDPADNSTIRPDWFKFDSTGELKNKLIEVVLVILAIKFFEQMVANIESISAIEQFLVIPVGAAILAISLGFFKWATE